MTAILASVAEAKVWSDALQWVAVILASGYVLGKVFD